jgi:phosphoglycerol transferase MdoB-like AlkP superfamily enzyme
VTIKFDFAEQLKTKGNKVIGFMIAAKDEKFVSAEAKIIHNNQVEVLFTRKTLVNPYKHYDDRTVDKIYKRLFITPSDTSVSILTTRRPNIVLIIMESMCADVFSCLNGEKRITPGLDSITRQGLLFSNIYAAGSRTDQGLLAIFSGYPALPQQSVIRDFERICNLPHISSAFNKAGYHTSYIIGGNLEYENTRSYMLTGQTKLLIDGNDYPVDRKTNWGAYDEDLFHEHLKVADSLPQPFFSAISTITNHEEFEGDVPELWKRDKMVNRFRNTAHYTDHCIAAYLKDAIGHPWFKNTIFIIVADHGHRFPKNRKYNEPGKFHIPLIFFGDVLKPELKGKTVGQIGSQYDIPATLLGQLGLDRTGFTWGKDLLNPGSAEFAWYSFDHGFGYITPAGSIVYDYNLKKTVMQDNTLSPEQALLLTNEGKLFLQIFYDHYLESGKPTR